MPSIQRTKKKDGSESYRVQVSIDGVRDSASFNTRAEAKRWGLQREAAIRLGHPLVAPPPTPPKPATQSQQTNPKLIQTENSRTLRDVLQRYRRDVSTTKLSRRWEEIKLNKFCTYPLADKTLEELGPEHLAAWRDQRLKEVSSSTVRRELTLIGHALEIARKEWRWIEANPSKDCRKPADNKHRVQKISDSDVDKLLQALKYVRGTVPANKQQEVGLALLLALETACRGGELLSLVRDHIHLEHCYFHLPTSKNGESRDVPLSPVAIQLVQLMLQKPVRGDGKLFSVNVAIKDALFRRAKNKAGLKHINFHDSRRTATTRLSETFNPLELSRITGHKNLGQLLTYYQKSASELAKKMS